MSRSCACFNGPPVSRTADKGKGRATSGIAFLICCARAEPNKQNRPKTANENINGRRLLILIVLVLINRDSAEEWRLHFQLQCTRTRNKVESIDPTCGFSATVRREQWLRCTFRD